MTVPIVAPIMAPTPPPPPPRRPLIERVSELERLLAKMADLHNKFATDVARELGLGDGGDAPA